MRLFTIIGPSGSGKSTLLRCMNLLEVPEEGQVIFEGTDLLNPKTNLNEIREHIGMVLSKILISFQIKRSERILR